MTMPARVIIPLIFIIVIYAKISYSRDIYQSMSEFSTWKGALQDPTSQRLIWPKDEPPKSVLVIKRIRDDTILPSFTDLVQWLTEEKHMEVFVEKAILNDAALTTNSKFLTVENKLTYFVGGDDDLTDKIDLVICLGGDGTLLYTSQLFQKSVPPVMAFHFGSLGFLTPFSFENFQQQIADVIKGNSAVTLRSRLQCIVERKNDETKKDTEVATKTNIMVLNEALIDRGPSQYLSNIDIFLADRKITTVQADGLLISTSTGSTAYAMSAGASIIHPSIPVILVTSICPHALTHRPVVIPAGVELTISLSPESRHTAWVAFDGRNNLELFHGDRLRITTSNYPVPTINAKDQNSDWFDSLTNELLWNIRKQQKGI